VQEHRNISALFVNGSFATIPLCAQIIADMFNKPVHLTKNVNSVGFGAFLLAATEMGIYKSLDEAASHIEIATSYSPSENHHKTYLKYFEIFESLSHKLGDEFRKIAALK
jgi:gluconokinase